MFIYLESLVKTDETMEDIFLITYSRYFKMKLESGAMIQIKTDKTLLGSNTNKNEWNKVKSFGKPPRATGGLNYPDFENNIPSNADDTMPFLNTLISKMSKKYFWFVKLIVRLFNLYDNFE